MSKNAYLSARRYDPINDPGRIAVLLAAVDDVLNLNMYRSPDELRNVFGEPGIDHERNSRIWTAPNGAVVAYAYLQFQSAEKRDDGQARQSMVLRFRAHPTFSAEIDTAAMTWAIKRASDTVDSSGQPLTLYTYAAEHDSARMALLERLPFNPTRYFLRLARDMGLPVAEPTFPNGFTVREADPDQDADGWIGLFNQTFIDHWDHHDLTRETYLHERKNNPAYKPRHDLICIAPDGTFAALCWSFAQSDGGVLLHQIGTRRGYRRQGLARAMMRTALRRLAEDGYARVSLFVDGDNPHDAGRLYTSEGFALNYRMIAYSLDLLPDDPVANDSGAH